MTANRTVTVKLRAEIAQYLAGMKMSEKATKDLEKQVKDLNSAGQSMSRSGGIVAALAGVPGVASAAAAGIAAVPAVAVSASASLGVLIAATNGVGDAFTAVADGDAKKLGEALLELSGNARRFVQEYQQVRPLLVAAGDRTQDAFFGQLVGQLDKITRTYLPTLGRQAPKLAAELGRGGAALGTWATAPETVARVNRQFDLALDITTDLNRLLRSGLGLILDLADAGRDFTRDTVGGLANGTEALERWVSQARASGQLNQIFENGGRILQRLGQIAGEAGELLADIVDNPALVDGAERLFDVLGLTLDVVHALLQVFEMLPSGVQSTIVTIGVLGGAALLVAGRIAMLKASLDKMKLSAVQAGTTLKTVGGVLGGPWGIAVTAAIGILGVFASKNADAASAADALRATLDEQTGAFTEATRKEVANQLAKNGSIKLAKELGVNLEDLTDAVMRGDAATLEFYKTVANAPNRKTGDWSGFIERISEVGVAVDDAKTGQKDFAAAVGNTGNKVSGTTGKIYDQITALQILATELRKQADPAFALIKAQQDLAGAQEGYNEAVKEFGKNSPQARAASVKLAEQAVILAEAVAGAAGSFDGKLTPAMRATLSAAQLTEQQIQDIEDAFVAAKGKGDQFAKKYQAKVEADTKAAQAAVQALILKVLQLKNKKIRIDANVYWTSEGNLHVGTGTQQRRWGGIDYHAAAGGSIQAHHATAPTVLYGERATGGEAFIPRNGDFGRSMSILSTAASWYGMQVGRPGAGGGGGPVSVELTLVMKSPNGKELRQTLRADAVGRGVRKAEIAVAYP